MDADDRRQWTLMQSTLATLAARMEGLVESVERSHSFLQEKLENADRDRAALSVRLENVASRIEPLMLLEQKLEFHRENMHAFRNEVMAWFGDDRKYHRQVQETLTVLERRTQQLEFTRNSITWAIASFSSFMGVVLGLLGEYFIRRAMG